MFELTGMAAIAGVLIGSVLLALFAGEALITWIIRAMSVGVRRADKAAAQLAGQPQSADWRSREQVRMQRA